jgi:hypothetical protein
MGYYLILLRKLEPAMVREGATWAARSFLLAILLGGCASYGPQALDRDRLDYGEAVAETVKQQALLNVVRIRYGDIPAFVSIEQLVSSYQLQTNGNVSVIPNPITGLNFPSWTAGATFTDRPTMTFSPVTGAVFEGSFVRPFTPREVLVLAQNGMWIDVLFRLAVQSVGSLSNAGRTETSLTSQSTLPIGSPEFFELLADLRALQEGGALSFRFTNPKTKDDPHVFLTILSDRGGALTTAAARARTLLGIGPGEAEVVYGRVAHGPHQIAMLTRSFIGILTSVSAFIDVPDEDVEAHRVLPSPGYATNGERPVVIVRTSASRPQSRYAAVAVEYRDRWFWIDDSDFESKDAFRTMLTLMQLAEGGASPAKAPVLTIPASAQ